MNPESQQSSTNSTSAIPPTGEQPGKVPLPLQSITPDDPLAPDAPVHVLLSLKHNVMLESASLEQLEQLVRQFRQLSMSPTTLTSKLNAESDVLKEKTPRAPRKSKGELSAKQRALLNDI